MNDNNDTGNPRAASSTNEKFAIPDGYLWAATDFLRGFQQLMKASSPVAAACCLLAAQSLECVLKGYISCKSDSRGRVKGHDLNRLWLQAVKIGLTIEEDLPYWAVRLNELHDSPYQLRYREREPWMLMPELGQMERDLTEIHCEVSRSIAYSSLLAI